MKAHRHSQSEIRFLAERYKDNERINFHAENTLLMAIYYGNEDDEEIAQLNVQASERLGRGLQNDLFRQCVYEIHSRCYDLFAKDCKASFIEL